MQRRLTYFFTCILTVFLLSSAFAAEKKPPLKIHTDTSKIAAKNFDANALNKFRRDRDFDYSGTSSGKPSLWELFWGWLWYSIGNLFSRIPFGGRIFQFTLIGICVSLLAYVVLKSLGIDLRSLWSGEAAKVSLPYNESVENIHEINFDAEIDNAIMQGNYRLAVRLLYLNCLKQLSDKQLIQWQIDKTNSAYLVELTDPEQKQLFRSLTRQFEYVWYGNFAITKPAFNHIATHFQTFKKQLS